MYEAADALEQEGLCDLAMRGFEAVSAYEDSRERAELLSETVKKSQDFTRALCLAEVGQQEQANEMLRSLEDFQNASLHIWPVANFSAKQLRDDKTSPKSDVFTAPDGTKHRYQIFKGVRTWKEAKVFCEVLGGHLATPTTDEENQFVYRFMRDSGYLTAYFGLSDEKRVGDWIWVTGEPFEYTNWHRASPAAAAASGTACTFISIPTARGTTAIFTRTRRLTPVAAISANGMSSAPGAFAQITCKG